jgi:uncharacterized protein (DUF58 family)
LAFLTRSRGPTPLARSGGGLGRFLRRLGLAAGARSELLTSLSDLELVARVTVDGTISGLHNSPFHGYSAEFHQYRHYRPGDDLKYVDWKLFARTDRVYTKQYCETTNLAAQLAIDASASMAYGGPSGGRSWLRAADRRGARSRHRRARRCRRIGCHDESCGDTFHPERASRTSAKS